MNKPTNFEKIKHKTFTEDAIEYVINEGTAGLWILPTDSFKNQFENVILLDMMWGYPQQQKRAVQVKFCPIGKGDKVTMTTSDSITQFDLQKMEHFVEWCRMLVTKYAKQIKK